MLVDPATDPVLQVYHTLVSVVTPRPIAWVTTVDVQGRINLAPFSFFNAFGANPPIVVFSPTNRRDGSPKDTLRNVQTTGEFVINAAVESLAEPMNKSSVDLPYGESEVELTGLAVRPSLKVTPPALVDSPVNLECKVMQILPIGTGPIAANLVIGQVVLFHINDAILDEAGRIDPRKLGTIARLGGDWYCRSTELFAMKRP